MKFIKLTLATVSSNDNLYTGEEILLNTDNIIMIEPFETKTKWITEITLITGKVIRVSESIDELDDFFSRNNQ